MVIAVTQKQTIMKLSWTYSNT